MLGASLVMLALVSGFVAFGSWPGAKDSTQVDQVFLNGVAHPKAAAKVAVRSDAVLVAERAAARRQAVAVAHARGEQVAKTPSGRGTPVAGLPGATAPSAAAPAGTPAGNQVASAPTTQVRQQTQGVTEQVDLPGSCQSEEGTYFIEVRRFEHFSCSDPYTLTVHAHF